MANASGAPTGRKQFIAFVKEGLGPGSYGSSSTRSSILSNANYWKASVDLKGEGIFPAEMAVTSLRPDIVIWSASERRVIFGELTAP